MKAARLALPALVFLLGGATTPTEDKAFPKQFILCGLQKTIASEDFRREGPRLTVAFIFRLHPDAKWESLDSVDGSLKIFDPNNLFIYGQPKVLGRALNESSFTSFTFLNSEQFVTFGALQLKRYERSSPDSMVLDAFLVASDKSGKKRNADHMYSGNCLLGKPDEALENFRGLGPTMQEMK
jgi:hypothetical protein